MSEHQKRQPLLSDNPYFAKAEAHIKTAGFIPVVDRVLNPVEWEEWIDYFIHHGLEHTAALMRQGASKWSVPTLSPRDFDPVGAGLAVESGRFRRAVERNTKRDLTAEDRARIVARLRPTFLPVAAKMKPGELKETPQEWLERQRREIVEAAKISPVVARYVKDIEERDNPPQDLETGRHADG